MNEEIVIEIDRAGGVTLEGKNFENADCAKFTKALEDDLGLVVASRELKPEYHRSVTNVRKVVR